MKYVFSKVANLQLETFKLERHSVISEIFQGSFSTENVEEAASCSCVVENRNS